MDEAQEKRFWPKADRSGGPDACWLWNGARDRKGYGVFAVDSRHRSSTRAAHRVAWEHFNGPLPLARDGSSAACLLHSCDTPACVNPAHLRLGTRAENNAEMRAKGRAGPMPRHAGAEHHAARLTAAQAVDIRERYARGGLTQRQLAAEYGISHTAVGYILRGRNWKSANDAARETG